MIFKKSDWNRYRRFKPNNNGRNLYDRSRKSFVAAFLNGAQDTKANMAAVVSCMRLIVARLLAELCSRTLCGLIFLGVSKTSVERKHNESLHQKQKRESADK